MIASDISFNKENSPVTHTQEYLSIIHRSHHNYHFYLTYQQFNMGGHYNGHCGRDVYGGYLKCTRSNMMCGSLQCQDGTSNPILQSTLSSTTVSRIVLTLDRQEHECKNLNSPKGDSAAANLELVRDGTRCGEEMVLIYFKNHQCHTF